MKKLKYYTPIIIMMLIAVVVGILIWRGPLKVEEIIAAVSDNKTVAFFVIMALFLLKGCSLGILHGAILVGCSLIFDPVSAIIINLFGTALCLSVSYIIGRTSKSLTFEYVIDKYPKFEKYFINADKHSFATCYVVHSLHLPTEVQGVLFGLLRTPYFDYLAASLIALLPSTLCYTVIGEVWDLKNPLVWVFLIMDAAVVIIGLWIGKKKILQK